MCVLYATPPITRSLQAELDKLDALRKRLGDQARSAGPWLGTLRRQMRASSAESSIEIEGYHVPEEERLALATGGRRPDPGDADRMALSCYGRAMDHIVVMAADPAFRWLDRVILDLHFDACYFQREKEPGLYRTRGIAVTSLAGGPPAFVGPPHEDVPGLMDKVVDWLHRGDPDAHAVVRAAMAHLHLVSVHPFRDGNGRIARIVQSLVLAREGLLAAELGSIEEYLGRNTDAYYATLQKVQGGSHQPERDATPWVRFCVRAHLDQAEIRVDQIAAAGERWSILEELVERRGWPERLVIALEQSLFRGTDRASYAEEADVSPATASADLRRLQDAGLLTQRGRGRTTSYVASETLLEQASPRRP
jgi:hypothetical protein